MEIISLSWVAGMMLIDVWDYVIVYLFRLMIGLLIDVFVMVSMRSGATSYGGGSSSRKKGRWWDIPLI